MSDIEDHYIYIDNVECYNLEHHTKYVGLQNNTPVNAEQRNAVKLGKCKWSCMNSCILLSALLIASTAVFFTYAILKIGRLPMADERASNASKKLAEERRRLLDTITEMKKYMHIDNLKANVSNKLAEDQRRLLEKMSEMTKYMSSLKEASLTMNFDHNDILGLLNDISRDVDEVKGRIFTKDPRDCSDLRGNQSGVYIISPDNRNEISVYCDMITESRGMTVIQRRLDGNTSFYRSWDEYKQGFGDLNSEFWIGNENLHILTTARNYMVRIDLEDFDGNTTFATYSAFKLGNESSKYQLHLGDYMGTAGDSFGKDDGAFFSTYDRDNDKWRYHCATHRLGAWWYKNCGGVNMNGPYRSARYWGWRGMFWWAWHKQKSLKSTSMSIIPI